MTEQPTLVKYIIGDVEFLVPPQYEIKKLLGSGKKKIFYKKGAYGVVGKILIPHFPSICL
jgi:hypothetical protein